MRGWRTPPRIGEGPLQQLVDDLQREKAAAQRCRAIFVRHVGHAVAAMREAAQATNDEAMLQIAAALETDDYEHLAP